VRNGKRQDARRNAAPPAFHHSQPDHSVPKLFPESLPKLDLKLAGGPSDPGDFMFFDNPMLFDQAAQELLLHLGHKIAITPYGGDAAPDSIAIECEDCHEPLIDFVPKSSASERPDPEQGREIEHVLARFGHRLRRT
jgi:hypothetical protein